MYIKLATLKWLRLQTWLKKKTQALERRKESSVIISHRPGPLPAPKRSIATPQTGPAETGPRIELPKSGIVHLVSLEGIEDNANIQLPFADSVNTRIGIVSLYSWTYNVLPPLSANFLDAMQAIGNQVPSSCMLRALDSSINAIVKK
jgi:hypothetical protein